MILISGKGFSIIVTAYRQDWGGRRLALGIQGLVIRAARERSTRTHLPPVLATLADMVPRM
jgi:hypothetical protein